MCLSVEEPGSFPTNGISIEFDIWSRFHVLWFNICSTDHNAILHTSRQLHCHDVCNFFVIGRIHFTTEHFKFWSNFDFDRNILSGTWAWGAFQYKMPFYTIGNSQYKGWTWTVFRRSHLCIWYFCNCKGSVDIAGKTTYLDVSLIHSNYTPKKV